MPRKSRRIRKTRRIRRTQRGGDCNPRHRYRNQTQYWQTILRILQENYDEDYRGEWHVNRRHGTCNLWVWKHDETSPDDENHIDIWRAGPDTLLFNFLATVHGRHRGGRYTLDLNDSENCGQEWISAQVACYINYIYDREINEEDITWDEVECQYSPDCDDESSNNE